MDGGGVVTSGDHVVTAWRREPEIFLASPGEKEVSIAEGMDVAIAATPNGVNAVWSTPTGIRALLAGQKEPISVSQKGAFSNMLALPNGQALVAWEDDGAIRIEHLDPGSGDKGR
jgi:hypothetical protein